MFSRKYATQRYRCVQGVSRALFLYVHTRCSPLVTEEEEETEDRDRVQPNNRIQSFLFDTRLNVAAYALLSVGLPWRCGCKRNCWSWSRSRTEFRERAKYGFGTLAAGIIKYRVWTEESVQFSVNWEIDPYAELAFSLVVIWNNSGNNWWKYLLHFPISVWKKLRITKKLKRCFGKLLQVSGENYNYFCDYSPDLIWS